MHPAAQSVDKLLHDCTVRRTRASGPGGQHRNKVETAIVLEHIPTKIRAEASERRSQEQNRAVAINRLRLRLALQHRTIVAPDVEPSALWQSRVPANKIAIRTTHDDFPALLAEALDLLHANDADVSLVATLRGVSTSQLVKFLKQEPAALALVNDWRNNHGLKRLK